MTIREFVKGIIENAFTDAEIIKYCKALDSELLADLLKELWAEYVSCDYVGELSNAQRLKNAYDLICERFNVDIWNEHPEPQQGNSNSEQAEDTQSLINTKLMNLFPEKYRTERAMNVLQKAFEDGTIHFNGEGLKFDGSNALLAYLLGAVYCGDTKEYDKYVQGDKVKRGSDYFPDTFLSKLFGVKNLGQSRLQLVSVPKGHEKVEKWLK